MLSQAHCNGRDQREQFDLGHDPAEFRRVMGHLPTSVSVITAISPRQEIVGMVVGTFTSVSLDPPLVGFLPDRRSHTWGLIRSAGHFCANVLAADQLAICRQIVDRREGKFAGIECSISAHGIPVITDALASVECRIHSVVDAGDHDFVIGRVLRLEAHRDAEPLLFHCGRMGAFSAFS